MSGTIKGASRRVAYAVPLTPWPVIFWFQAMPDWSGGAHGASALAGIHKAIFPMLGATNAIGLMLCLSGLRSWKDLATWTTFATVHLFLLFGYVATNTFWYV